jgi:hypothetical protein
MFESFDIVYPDIHAPVSEPIQLLVLTGSDSVSLLTLSPYKSTEYHRLKRSLNTLTGFSVKGARDNLVIVQLIHVLRSSQQLIV